MVELEGAEALKLTGITGIAMMLIYIARLMRNNHLRHNGEEGLIASLRREIDRLSTTVREMSEKIDRQREECAREIRERDDRIVSLERDVGRLLGIIQQRNELDELGRQGKIERRQNRIAEQSNEQSPAGA